MSKHWTADVERMHDVYGFRDAVARLDEEGLRSLLEFRKSMLREEMRELEEAETAEDVVDALIDLCVFAIGTLDLFEVDGDVAWNEVHQANMTKEVGVKPGRPNPLGLPDLTKPKLWRGPSHVNNLGLLESVLEVESRD